jgi:hypothetical protein
LPKFDARKVWRLVHVQLSRHRIVPLLSALASGEMLKNGGERFVRGAPSPQTTIDAVSGTWASHLPLPGVRSGEVELFSDARVDWAIEALGGVNGARCVELGPLEGGHSYMLEKAGAVQVVAVEANKDAYLKCLVVKELLELQHCSFLCGDAAEYLKVTAEQFDVCWCAGILYHMVNPLELIDLVSQKASRLYMWTHYYDAAKLQTHESKGKPFASKQVSDTLYQGYRYQLHRHEYSFTTRLRGFWGGTQAYSNWLTLDGLLGALEHFGWSDIQTQVDEDHPHGPAVNLVALRT